MGWLVSVQELKPVLFLGQTGEGWVLQWRCQWETNSALLAKKWRQVSRSAPKVVKMKILRNHRRHQEKCGTFLRVSGKFVNKNAISVIFVRDIVKHYDFAKLAAKLHDWAHSIQKRSSLNIVKWITIKFCLHREDFSCRGMM